MEKERAQRRAAEEKCLELNEAAEAAAVAEESNHRREQARVQAQEQFVAEQERLAGIINDSRENLEIDDELSALEAEVAAFGPSVLDNLPFDRTLSDDLERVLDAEEMEAALNNTYPQEQEFRSGNLMSSSAGIPGGVVSPKSVDL